MPPRNPHAKLRVQEGVVVVVYSLVSEVELVNGFLYGLQSFAFMIQSVSTTLNRARSVNFVL
jgi:hypothetical protein